MWTNVFRLGELQAVSWFQFFPSETDLGSLSEKSRKAEQKDSATYSILSAHLQLQNEGFLSTWTNSFVGPWDPSQGAHNPDEKIKLWLFLPGYHSSINETAQAAVSRLRVFGNGLWLAPGDSEEVGVALSQALRNSIERSLRGLYYVRYGDVFTRCHPLSSNIRGLQPTIEFIFTANEEGVYVHAIVSAKHVRGLRNNDMEKLLWHFSTHSVGDGIPVIVAPSGMRGRLTGCCPNDLVKQVYNSKLKASNGIGVGIPFPSSQLTGCQLKGQNCYVEVTLGCRPENSTKVEAKEKNSSHLENEECHLVSVERGQQKQGAPDMVPIIERTFIYPAEAVLVPMMHKTFARSSIRSCWLQSWTKTSVSETWPLWSFSDSSSLELCLALANTSAAVPFNGLGIEYSDMKLQKEYNTSSDSITSSISSISRTSSESEHVMAVDTGDLEADADSLACRQSGFSSSDRFDNDGNKMVLKRPHIGATDALVQVGTVVGSTIQDAFMADFSVLEANNLATIEAQDAQMVSLWDCDDGGVLVDIQILLSEFGDFGDFFRDDVLNFGEPPGTAESQVLIIPSADYGDVMGSPCAGSLEVSEKLMLSGVASLDGIDHVVNNTEDSQNRSTELPKDSSSGLPGSVALISEFDYITKDEAMMTFAPEYAPVDTSSNDSPTSIFRSPYIPTSKKVETSNSCSNTYLYSAAPPLLDASEDKPDISIKFKLNNLGLDGSSSIQSSNLYTLIQSGAEKKKKRPVDNDAPSSNGEVPSSMSGMKSFGAPMPMQKKIDNLLDPSSFLLPSRTVLATDIECLVFQSAMCRIRHTLLSLRRKVPMGLSFISEVSVDANSKIDTMSIIYDLRKIENIPVRISGDIEGVVQDEPLTAQVGVWRAAAPKGTKPSRFSDNLSSLPHTSFNDEWLAICGQRQSLQDLLDALTFLVQQSTSFVDVSLDANDGYGSYNWLGVQEQRRREFACGPSMIHAGCGGLLATCHSLDIAGVDLIDPLSADVYASSVISLLHSDIKVSLRSAFGSSDGPLSLVDWCKGRSSGGELGAVGDANETKDSSSTVVADPTSPSQPAGALALSREGGRSDESSHRRLNLDMSVSDSDQKGYLRLRPTIFALPLPSILVGYQDDWLKSSVNALQLWEKCPLEPYASQKPVHYYALCPDIDLLTSAAVDFFQQLGTVYELCKLGPHTPQPSGGHMELSTGKFSSSGLVLVDCPQQVKIGTSHMNIVSSISDYFLSISKSWNIRDYIKSLRKIIKNLNFTQSSSMNQKESSTGTCTVLYVVCPFPEPLAVLQTLVECSAALGSVVFSPDKEKRALLYSQVGKALNCTASIDEASASSVVMLSGFSVPKLVLQMITVDSLLRINKPTSNLAIYKDIAFTVYNKARRISRSVSTPDMFQLSPFSGRSQPTLMQINSPIPNIWKDCPSRISSPSLTREGDLDASLRSGTWDNSWQTPRVGGLAGDQSRSIELCGQDETRYMYEPLFILSEPGSVDAGVPAAVYGSPILESSSLKPGDDTVAVHTQNSVSAGSDTGITSFDGPEYDNKAPSLHCSYGWTEDWRWLICLWTDSRGELLDSSIFPFGGISSRQDTKVLQSIFLQILQQGYQILSSASSDAGHTRPRDIIISRIGCFFELECQEWQKAIYSYGGNDIKKWPLQLRRLVPDGISTNSNGTLQQHDLGLIQERNLPSSSSGSLYSPHSKSNFAKGGLGPVNMKKPILPGQTGADNIRGPLQLVQSISLVGVSLDHSLQLILQADMSSGGSQGSNASSYSSYLEGFSPLKSLGSMQASYLFIPSPSMRNLSPSPLQLPTCLTSESPPLAHLLHSKGSAIPISTGYVVSKAVQTMRQSAGEPTREEWPSILAVSLVNHYGGNNSITQERNIRGGGSTSTSKQANRDFELESRMVLESVASELNSLSWLTASPVYLERRTALPFHCDMLLRLRRLLYYADKELTKPPENL